MSVHGGLDVGPVDRDLVASLAGGFVVRAESAAVGVLDRVGRLALSIGCR